VALEYGVYHSILRELYPGLRLRELRITGGGEKSAVWNDIKADVLGTRVARVSQSEGAPMGAALVAGYGVGLFKSLPKTAEAWVAKGQVHRPNTKMKQYYAARIERYKTLLHNLNPR